MKAEELMIGDLVLFDRTYPHTEKKPTRLTLQDIISIVQGKECEPIPLTPEILEKNGFIKDGSQIYRKVNTNYYIIVNPQMGSMHIEGIDGNCNRFSRYYVHELQHALRICGLDDLAKKFKV